MPRLTRLQLWNAHRPIKELVNQKSRRYEKALKLSRQKPLSDIHLKVGQLLGGDLRKFLKEAKLSQKQCVEFLQDPRRYFSYPDNVPVHLRKQVYLPNFKVNLFRTPHLPPKYASFDVPLWFNKFDMRSYLASVYDVDVLHVRSTVYQQKVTRDQNGRRGSSNQGTGRLRRPASKKRMTVELVEPFVWPEEIKDLDPWEHKTFYDAARYQLEGQQQLSPDAILKPNEKHRKSIAEQAREVMEGKMRWKPTWQSLPIDLKAMKSSRSPPPAS